MRADLTVYIGWDSREPAAAAVLAHSILTRASKPVWLMPLTLKSVSHVYTRVRGPYEATEFSLTRFLVPYLSGYQGYSLFVDCDMLCQADIYDLLLFVMADPEKAVHVCQHDYVPKSVEKMDGQIQTAYPRKNWSSLMLMDNAKCKALTPAYVNTASPADLHRFAWLQDEQIGALPLSWNWLIGEYPKNATAQMLHFTNGLPWLDAYRNCDHADRWFDELSRMLDPIGAALQPARIKAVS